jgi:hypothetical protein
MLKKKNNRRKGAGEHEMFLIFMSKVTHYRVNWENVQILCMEFCSNLAP